MITRLSLPTNMLSRAEPRQLIINFAKSNPSVKALKFILEDPEGFEIGDISAHGMMNTIFRVRSKNHTESLILKYGETSPRIDPTSKVPISRQLQEFNSLRLLNEILPGCAPQAYVLDTTYNIIAMEDFGSWELLGIQLQKGHVDLEAASSLGRLLADMHYLTSKRHVSPQRWRDLEEKLSQDRLKKEFIAPFNYVSPYSEDLSCKKIPDEILESFKSSAREIRALKLPEKLTNLYKANDCFMHGDCHWKSVFVKDGKTALLDLEWSSLGCASQDLGVLLTAYLFCYHNEKKQFQAQCVQAVCILLNAYLEWHPDFAEEDKSASFIQEVSLFLGNALVLYGSSVMDESDFHTDSNRTFLICLGFKVLKAHQEMTTVEKLVNAVFLI